jgi:hypothetical protein
MGAVALKNSYGVATATNPVEAVDGVGDVPRSVIEMIRVEELQRLTDQEIEEPLMDPIPWEGWAEDHPELVRRIRRSMWDTSASRSRAAGVVDGLRQRLRALPRGGATA